MSPNQANGNTPGVVIGANLKSIRESAGMSQREYVVVLRGRGVPWSHSQLAAIESGRREDVDLRTLALLVAATETTAAELLTTDEPIDLSTDRAMLDGAALWQLLSGTGKQGPLLTGDLAEVVVANIGTATDADDRLADRLGVAPAAVMAAAERLWGHSMTEERGRREREVEQPDDSKATRATRRGHITRALADEVVAQLNREAGA